MKPGSIRMKEGRPQRKLAKDTQAHTPLLSHPVDLGREPRAEDTLGEIRALAPGGGGVWQPRGR